MLSTPSITRRQAIGTAALAGLVATLAPKMVLADEALLKSELKALFADKPMTEGRIKLDIPGIAENGFVVPVNIDVASPMTETDYVRAVHLFASLNPVPHVLTYHFTPESGKAATSARIRLAQSEDVIVIAEMSDGSLYTTRAAVKVTVGGCGG